MADLVRHLTLVTLSLEADRLGKGNIVPHW